MTMTTPTMISILALSLTAAAHPVSGAPEMTQRVTSTLASSTARAANTNPSSNDISCGPGQCACCRPGGRECWCASNPLNASCYAVCGGY